jgi:hypothetical protein
MRRFLSYRPSAAMIVACVALFVALGGVGYAAATIGSAQIKNNSVRSVDIKNNDVRSKDIRNNSVTSSDIRNGTVRGKDVHGDTLTGKQVLESSLGTVPSANSASISKLTYKTATFTDPGTGFPGVHGQVSCDAGQHVVGGGAKVGNRSVEVVQGTYPVGTSAWGADVVDDFNSGTPSTDTVYAICAPAAATG